jgi:hypothetical protein
MPDCERLKTCPFYSDRMRDMPRHAELFRQLYCRRDNSSCARHMVFKKHGKDAVPDDMFPNEVKRAQKIIHGGHGHLAKA